MKSFTPALRVIVPLWLAAACGADTESGLGGDAAAPGGKRDAASSAARDAGGSTSNPRPVDAAAVDPTPVDPGPVGGPCEDTPKAKATQSVDAPSVYGGAWTAAPTEGCSFVDGEGRTVNLTAAQHRMLYRVNEVRALQSAADGQNRPMLEADFCLQEFSQGYVESNPSGHSAMNLTVYPMPNGGRGSGGNFIGENYGYSAGSSQTDWMANVDRRILGWWNSGSTTTGHRGNMLNPEWTKGGMGVQLGSNSIRGIQTFSRKYANWLWGWDPCTQPPRVNDPMSTIPEP